MRDTDIPVGKSCLMAKVVDGKLVGTERVSRRVVTEREPAAKWDGVALPSFGSKEFMRLAQSLVWGHSMCCLTLDGGAEIVIGRDPRRGVVVSMRDGDALEF